VILQAAFTCCLQAHHAVHGQLEGEKIALLAFGKLGSREMNATSDIDFILLYEGAETTSNGLRPLARSHYFARFMQRFISILSAPTSEGTLYEVDMRLRPSGRSGPLATAFSHFITYQHQEAEVWERLALTRARVICATKGFDNEVSVALVQILKQPPAHVFKETAAMRRLITQEKSEKNSWALKYAAGGLIDIEFIAQALQAKYAFSQAQNPRLLVQQAKKYLTPWQRETLLKSYDLQNALMQMLRLCLPAQTQDIPLFLQKQLAQAGQEPDFKALEAKLFELQASSRAIFTQIMQETTL
jgi:[glutamine synthetase] adenylyltransferase / [glutamine synthetase]-adenylyl-L-tyrosine phosphorylase